MNDDHPTELLVALKREHRELDQQIAALLESGTHDQIEVARLKKRKLQVKDQIELINDSAIPDIIA
jgi:hypothetical protein